jgi:carbon-monoxide dehydrogenase medium subunit
MSAVFLRIDGGQVIDARLGVGGAADRPSRIEAADALLIVSDGGVDIRVEAGRIAAEVIEPLEDVQAGGDFRRQLVRAMVERALTQAITV